MKNYWLKNIKYTEPKIEQKNSYHGEFSGKWIAYKYEKDEWNWYQQSLEWWDGCQQADPMLKTYYLQRDGFWKLNWELNKTNQEVIYFDTKEALLEILEISY